MLRLTCLRKERVPWWLKGLGAAIFEGVFNTCLRKGGSGSETPRGRRDLGWGLPTYPYSASAACWSDARPESRVSGT